MSKPLQRKILAAFIVFGLFFFFIDAITPLGFGVWISYLLLLAFYRYFSDSRYVYQICFFYIILIIVGYIISPPGLETLYALINRTAAIASLLIIAFLAAREREVKKVNSEILDRVSDSFIALDTSGKVIYMNKRALTLFNKPDLIDKNLWEEVPELKSSLYREKIDEAIKTQKAVMFKLLSADNSYLYQVSAYPSSKGVSVFSRDITKLEEMETNLRHALRDKELLLRETHHRVKNNFQLISSLLGLSMSNIESDEVQSTVSVIQNRIRTLAAIHEKFYQTANIATIDIKSFIEDLFSSFHSLREYNLQNVDTEIYIDKISLNINSAIPIGLIINELYTNSLKHAFKGRDNCRIRLNMNFINGSKELLLIYRDNGVGLPETLEITNPETLGFTIIAAFVEQLNGNFNYRNNNGAEFSFNFKV